MNSDPLKEILSYTLKVFNNSLLIEEQNSMLKENIKEFDNVLSTTQMDLDICRAKMNELNEKKVLLQNKREELANVQKKIINLLDNSNIITDLSSNPSDYVGVPPVLMFILETLYSATENQLISHEIKIPISQVLEISDAINEMYNKLVDSNIIFETDEESQERNENIAQNQQIFMNELIGSIDAGDVDVENNDINSDAANDIMINSENGADKSNNNDNEKNIKKEIDQ